MFKYLCLAMLPAICLAGPLDTNRLKVGSAGMSNPIHSNVSLNEISTHAFRHFNKHYPEAVNEYWLKQNDRYIVSFMGARERTEVYYDKHGNFMYDVRYYEGCRLANFVQKLEENLYPGYQIAMVIDITDADHNNILLLKIANSQDLKTLRYFEGKMEVVEEFVHGNISPLPSRGD